MYLINKEYSKKSGNSSDEINKGDGVVLSASNWGGSQVQENSRGR